MAANPPTPDPTSAAGDGSPGAARDALHPGRPETDPAATADPGARAYEDLPVRGTPQGALSPGATEPGDMAAPDARSPEDGGREARAHERPRADGAGYRG